MLKRLRSAFRKLRVCEGGLNQLAKNNIIIRGGGIPIFEIGQYSYINSATLYCWKNDYSLRIGNYCSLAENISFILGGEHDTEWVSSYPFYERWQLQVLNNKATKKSRGDIEIESDVWIGHGATILSGSKISVGSIVGAGAVVRGDIPAYSIAVGVPARVIKRRFSDEVCDNLINTKWWEMSREELTKYAFFLDDPVEFIKKIMILRGSDNKER